LAADLRALTAIHRVRVAKKARELSERTDALQAADNEHRKEVRAQQELFVRSDSAVASLEVGSSGVLSSQDIQFASEYSTASRWAAWDKIEVIEQLKVKRTEAMAARVAAQQAWRSHDIRRQSIESLADKVMQLERKTRDRLEETNVDEGFLDGFASRVEASQ
jgi:hypothetical protein